MLCRVFEDEEKLIFRHSKCSKSWESWVVFTPPKVIKCYWHFVISFASLSPGNISRAPKRWHCTKLNNILKVEMMKNIQYVEWCVGFCTYILFYSMSPIAKLFQLLQFSISSSHLFEFNIKHLLEFSYREYCVDAKRGCYNSHFRHCWHNTEKTDTRNVQQ